MSKYYYYVTKDTEGTTSYFLECQGEFPIAEINKQNPDKVIIFFAKTSKKQFDNAKNRVNNE